MKISSVSRYRARSILSLLIAAALVAGTVALSDEAARAAETQVTSPDGNVVVAFELKEIGGVSGCPVYRVDYKGKAVLADSRLGLQFQGAAPLDAGLGLVRVTRSGADTTWKRVCGERSSIRDHYNQAVFDLREDANPHRQLQLTFRAYDEGAAFCYALPEQPGLKDFTVSLEETQFHFTGDYTTWAVYTAQGDYTNGEVPLSKLKPGVERPLTVRIADDLYASVTEAKTVDYARMKLRPAKDEPNTLEAFLDAERGNYGQVTGTTPFTSPWRVVMAADSPGKLLEQDYLVLNLNDPCALTDVSWIRPGKVIRETTLTTAGGKACVDFCIDRGMQFIELDAGWYGKESDPKSDARAVDPKRTNLNLQEVIDYGNARGIGVILYVNHLALEKQLDEILPLYHKWGVKGVKFGFVNVGSQHWTSWLHEAVRKAADNRLMVDIHDEFRNTGYQRTWPNLMTVEGIGGDETFPTPAHNATLPFTRFLTGPADHTFCWYSGKLKTTHAHQLAISTIFFSPWQFLYWYDKPSQYKGEPELDYWKDMPTTWDETRVVHGDIARRVTVARRKGDDWFVGSINPGGPAQMDVPLTFLTPGKKYTAMIYSDKEPEDAGSKAVKIETMPVDSTTVLKADIGANGGQAVRIIGAAAEPGGRANNPEYKSWARFNPGTMIRWWKGRSGHGEKLPDNGGTTTLVEVTPDKIMLEVKETDEPAESMTVPAKIDADAVREPGSGNPTFQVDVQDEELKVGDKSYPCHVVERSWELSKYKVWKSAEVPGGLVKSENGYFHGGGSFDEWQLLEVVVK